MALLRKALSGFLLCSLGCGCLVTGALAADLGPAHPCGEIPHGHHEPEPADQKHCCGGKIEAWRKVTFAAKTEPFAHDPPAKTAAYSPVKSAQKRPVITPLKAYNTEPPGHVFAWKKVRLRI